MFMSNILASSSFSLGVTGTSRMLCHQLLPSWGIHECELYGVLACPSCQLNDHQEILVESWGVSDRYPSLTLHQSYAAIVYLLLYDTTASRATKCCKLPCYMVQGKICRNPPPCYMFKKTWRRKPGVAGNPFASGMCEEKLAFYNKPRIMATCGSKGSPINLCQMMACVGQLLGVNWSPMTDPWCCYIW